MFVRIGKFFRHIFFPHTSNNFRAKLLHNSGWAAVIGIFVTLNLFVRIIDSSPAHILGFTSSITIDEVVRLTNERRIAEGLQPLKYNEVLADAARRKAANMLEENYWSHNSPSGKNPWVWFTAAGYRYSHAGENLAKDFGSTDRMVDAWMDSPTHRANIVSDKFQDIGIAVVPGTLLGKETVLVVQLFGSTTNKGAVTPQAATPQVAQVKGIDSTTATPAPVVVHEQTQEIAAPPANVEPAPIMELKEFVEPDKKTSAQINEFDLKRYISLGTTGLLILVLLADVLIAESRQLSRRVGKNWAHIMYINVILILVAIVNAGIIL